MLVKSAVSVLTLLQVIKLDPIGCYRPIWRTIMDSFHGVGLSIVERSGKPVHSTIKGLTALRKQILQLLKVPITVYTSLRDQWWWTTA